jgi:hypothetical protein
MNMSWGEINLKFQAPARDLASWFSTFQGQIKKESSYYEIQTCISPKGNGVLGCRKIMFHRPSDGDMPSVYRPNRQGSENQSENKTYDFPKKRTIVFRLIHVKPALWPRAKNLLSARMTASFFSAYPANVPPPKPAVMIRLDYARGFIVNLMTLVQSQ